MEDYKKKYEQALKRAIKWASQPTVWSSDDICQKIFPELKESWDDVMRKMAIKAVYAPEAQSCIKSWGVEPKDVISWLEKQGEQKEVNLVEILKHYPRETELYSPLYGKLWLAEVNEEHEIITCYKYPLEEGCTRAILEQEDTVSFYSNGTTGLPDFNISKDCMLFLYNNEKQGKQKPTDEIKPKFKVGDWIIHHRDNSSVDIMYVYNIRDGRYYFNDNVHFSWSVKECDEKCHLWTIQDAKDGDVLTWGDNKCIALFKEIYNKHSFKSHGCIGACTNVFENWWFHDIENANPATKEQCELLFSKMKEAGYEWDAEKKELKKIEQNPTWSEEDEKIYNLLYEEYKNIAYYSHSREKAEDIPGEVLGWLKSLKERMKGE